ncbi:MAG: hypothetical protein JXA10_13605 [Anaerolineae bacterium]|nr:hypothetical protein [Anaerolineae bacterium]
MDFLIAVVGGLVGLSVVRGLRRDPDARWTNLAPDYDDHEIEERGCPSC